MIRTGAAAKSVAVILACAGMVLPNSALQAAETDPGSKHGRSPSESTGVIDVALDEGGTLHGQVVDAQGNPVVETSVVIYHLDRQIASAVTDPSGHFRVSGLRGGMYRVVTGQTTKVYRFWSPGTAPPSVRSGTLVVPSEEQALGQGHTRFWHVLRNPWFVGAVVAAAIILPVALHDSDAKSR